MEWNVYTYNFNARKVEPHNIFKHSGFIKDCQKALKEFKDDKEQFIEAVRRSLMYYYWSKCEWEIVISDFPPRPDFPDAKVDVYDQIRLNWDVFVDYLWEHRNELRKRQRR